MPRQVQLPLARAISASATVTTSSASASLKGTTNAILLGDAVTFVLDVTALTITGGPANLDVYIDSSPDGGTTWYTSLHFATVTASTNMQRVDMRTIGIGYTEAVATSNLGAGLTTTSTSINNTIILADHRVRWQFPATATGPSATFALWGYFQPFGTYAS